MSACWLADSNRKNSRGAGLVFGYSCLGLDKRARLGYGLAFGVSAGAAGALMRGFTVDDALISVQYARNIAAGAGYRFDATGPSTDGVTPLAWPFLLAPLAHADAWTVLLRAQWLGIVAWSMAAAALGVSVARIQTSTLVKLTSLALLLASLPVAAHSASGMETGVVMALATAAVALSERGLASTALAALAAAFRPELAPWALAWSAGRAIANGEPKRRVAWLSALSLSPAIACACARAVVFGHPYPLALLAKPSDLEHGSTYVLAGLVVSALPMACLAPLALGRAHAMGRAIGVAFVVHVVTVALVGGDWMPYARLFAPVVPGLVLVYVHGARESKRAPLAARSALAIAAGAYFWAFAAPRGMGVIDDRARLVSDARPLLTSCRKVAAVDIGWVSATGAHVVDLAGLTDPEIAVLPGGHTSKHVDAGMLLGRGVDCAVFYVEPGLHDASLAHPETITFAHAVSQRLAQSELFSAHWSPRAKLALGTGDRGYVVFVSSGPAER